jgi:hypothetical protein
MKRREGPRNGFGQRGHRLMRWRPRLTRSAARPRESPFPCRRGYASCLAIVPTDAQTVHDWHT